MNIAYRTTKLKKLATTEKELVREFGANVAKAIKLRIATMEATPNLNGIPSDMPTKRHLLKGDRKGQWSIAARDGICICLVPDHDPMPLNEDGSVDLTRVVSVEVVDIGDYH